MPANSYNRYKLLQQTNGTSLTMPFVPIPVLPSDKYVYWNDGFDRMDKLSNKYYGNPFYDFIILNANPQYNNEWEIPAESVIRIPFPLDKSVSNFENTLNNIINS